MERRRFYTFMINQGFHQGKYLMKGSVNRAVVLNLHIKTLKRVTRSFLRVAKWVENKIK